MTMTRQPQQGKDNGQQKYRCMLQTYSMLVCVYQQFSFRVFREGVFAEISLINVSLGFSVQGVVSSGVMLLGCKPIAKFLAGRSPSTDPPCQKDQEPFSLAVPGCVCVCADCCAHPAEHLLYEFSPKKFCTFRQISANFPQNFRNLHWCSRNDFREFPAKFLQNFRHFSKFSLQCEGVVIVRS